MRAVILCGGESSRMGSDKGLLTYQSGTWAQTAAEKFLQINVNVVVSVNDQQKPFYLRLFPEHQLITDDKNIRVRGPLLGLLSVHTQFPGEDLFVLACDMPLMQTGILTLLLQHAAIVNAEAYLFTRDGFYEPLCGIYTAAGLSRVLLLQKTQQLAKHSMTFVLEELNTSSIPLTDEQKKYFKNINTHTELDGL
ncbi:MAG: molybdenum cofactor guanylyltransferase [Chitinophagaceae bacterium]